VAYPSGSPQGYQRGESHSLTSARASSRPGTNEILSLGNVSASFSLDLSCDIARPRLAMIEFQRPLNIVCFLPHSLSVAVSRKFFVPRHHFRQFKNYWNGPSPSGRCTAHSVVVSIDCSLLLGWVLFCLVFGGAEL
jgi:hypothetical protein